MMKKTLTLLQFVKMIFKAIASVAIALNIIGISAAYSQNMQTDISNLLDGPVGQTSVQRDSKEEFSYEDVLSLWKSIDDINDWIVKNFSYDTTRAMKLAINQEESRPAVFSPAETFLKKSGVCIDCIFRRHSARDSDDIRPRSMTTLGQPFCPHPAKDYDDIRPKIPTGSGQTES